MSLTDSGSPNKVTKKRFPWWILIVILLIAIGIVVYLKGWYPHGDQPGWTEDKLPAVKVVVLNGCGFVGLASEFAEHIKDKNIDVVSLGDTPKPIYDKSVIVVRKGDAQDLKRLQKMTGIERSTLARTEYFLADFEIIIGRDFELYMN